MKKVLHILSFNFEKSYASLHVYANIILMKNTALTVKIQYEFVFREDWFRRIFVSYNVIQKGFILGCRRFIGVDGCHLKTSYGGVLLTTVGIFPLAFCLYKGENK